MAFGGNMASSVGALALSVNIQPPLPEAPAANNVYDGSGRLRYLDAAAMEVGGGQRSLHTLLYLMTDNGSPATPVLSAFVDATLDGTAADTGILLAAAPAPFSHSLPVNFGPGRGNWQLSDLPRLEVTVLSQFITTPAVTSNAVIVTTFLTASNVRIIVKNTSAQAIAELSLRLRYDHTISF